jgi:hypothetical protein
VFITHFAMPLILSAMPYSLAIKSDATDISRKMPLVSIEEAPSITPEIPKLVTILLAELAYATRTPLILTSLIKYLTFKKAIINSVLY